MSEEILRALMQLFALIVKQDEGVLSGERAYVESFLNQQLNQETAREYLKLFDGQASEETDKEDAGKRKLTSVKDSVRVLGICRKINKTLTQEQKVVSLLRLFELVNADRKFSAQRMAIINTVAEVFKVSKEEFKSIETFVLKNKPEELDLQDILLIAGERAQLINAKFIGTGELQGIIAILRVPSVDLYFLKYTGNESLFLNGLGLNKRRIYLFAGGSTVKMPKGKPVYYSDVAAHFLADLAASKISFEVKDLDYRFPNGAVGLRNISFAEGHGRLIGIMGASGAGKTTLLNVLCGLEKPSKGEVLINGVNLHTEREKLEGVIGYIPQDDLLIEELTVFENLYYNARLCFRDKTEEELVALVEKTLHSLGLHDRKDLKVGSPLNKTISGGQRKRLNIALELLREPSILFVDEPTSGLSSSDSENVMDLLRELVLKGKLIFVVIHQPSSDIYKMFDKMIILDTGGYLIYYGNPVEAVMYFKRIDAQINSDVGECPVCGNVNPELIFNIIEARVVDEFGRYTDRRKISPPQWEDLYRQNYVPEKRDIIGEKPPKALNIPGRLKQLRIYVVRDLLSKISNRQYLLLTMLEAPALAFILAYVIRYIADPMSNTYIFRENENIPIFIFMSLIVALFLGLIVSAEEIFRDRKILKREAFLNLSKSSYLISKISILIAISAVQSLLFVLIANTILEVKGMYLAYWLALFSTAVFANILGLNISAAFNSAVTIYIIIPLLMIPMMVLSGAMFSFDKLNRNVGSINKVPLVAEFMVTRWSYEALMVRQYKDNRFEQYFYDMEKRESNADFRQVYLIPELEKRFNHCFDELLAKGKVTEKAGELKVLRSEVQKELDVNPDASFDISSLSPDRFDADAAVKLEAFIGSMNERYMAEFARANTEKERLIGLMLEQNAPLYARLKNSYQNEHLGEIVKKSFEKNKILEFDCELVQQTDPIYKDPAAAGLLGVRTHFFAPRKYFAGTFFDTYGFNICIIWIYSILLYVALYFDWLKKLLDFFGRIRFKKNS
jgi:ABC-type multidrug transport system ATPase subunit